MNLKSILLTASMFIVTVAFTGCSMFSANESNNVVSKNDINGRVDVTYAPPTDYDATDTELDAAKSVIEKRLTASNITDYDVHIHYNSDKITLNFSWPADNEDFDPKEIVTKLKKSAQLTFREGLDGSWENGGSYKDLPVIVSGEDVESAYAQYALKNGNTDEYDYMVAIKFKDSGKQKFAEATERLAASRGYISAYIDDEVVSVAGVGEKIVDGQAVISGGFTCDEAMELADMINGGMLPFELEVISYDATPPKAD